jgi:outer membrane protein assembly factor BamD
MPKAIDRDQSTLDQASDNLATVFRNYPQSPYAKLAQEKYDGIRSRQAKKNMYIGKFYYKYGQYIAAIPRFLTVLQDFPELGFDEDALYRLAISYHKLGETEKAQGAAQLMQEKFPNSSKTKSIVKKIVGGQHG